MFSSVTLQIICNLLVFLFWHAFHLSFQSLYGASLYIGLSLSKFILLSLYLRIFLTCVDFVFTHVVLYTLMFFLLPLVPLVLFHIDIRFPPPPFILLAPACLRRVLWLSFSYINGLCLRSRWSPYLLPPCAPSAPSRWVCPFLLPPFTAVWTRVLYHSQMNQGSFLTLMHFFFLTFVMFVYY